MTTPPDESAVRDALRQVLDPEAGMNIVDLGLVYGIDVSHTAVRIDLTMTSAACPLAESIIDEVSAAVAAVTPPDTQIDVALVWDPPWTPDRMSDFAREHFGWAPR
ncbi:MAG TPA: metal-sulfur cluster assembly factor [Burkholderiaceae bacterium]|nr:metal-sulfur cluster assembly factor [Burkholderiaceae bacterium]